MFFLHIALPLYFFLYFYHATYPALSDNLFTLAAMSQTVVSVLDSPWPSKFPMY